MPPSAGRTPTRRKRQLSLVAQEAAAEPSQPISSTKKRRLNDAGSSAVASTGAATATAAISKSGHIVSGALSDAWNFGRRIASGRASSTAQTGESVQSTYEVPDSDDEAKANKPDTKTASNAAAKPASAGRTRAAQHVYDVPDSDTEQDPAGLTPQLGRRKDTAPLSRSRLEEDSGRRTSGRQRKPTAKLSEALAKSVPEPDAEQPEAETPSKRRPGRQPAGKARPNGRASSEIGELFPPEALHDPSLVSSKLVPRKRKTPAGKQRVATPKTGANVTSVANSTARKPREPPTTGKSAEVVFDDLPSGRAKRVAKPSLRVAEMVNASPAKTKRTKQISRTAKNGVDKRTERQEQEEEEQDEESDIEEAGEIHAEAEDPAQPEEAGEDEKDEEDEEPEDEDDEVCTVCSKPDSKASNKILFCDSCDMAVHQKCYGIMFIPKGDWFCRSCAPEEQDRAEGSALDQDAPPANDQPPGIAYFGQHLGSMQRVLLDRCTGRRRIKLRGQDEAYEKTTQVIEQTIVAGEGNSMLIIGARGSGKTTLVESILDDMGKAHRGEFHVVRLSGFVHTDDKLAVKEIWQQLGKELEGGEDDHVEKSNNYADTMAYMLSLLSHPSDFAEGGQDGVTSQSVIFVIDEFDLFATHGRQTLLYNLFDIAQAKKAPIAVLGLTTRIDVVDSLEKRVKSRFSHRYVYLSLPKSVPGFWDICKQGLTIEEDDMRAEGIDATVDGYAPFWEWWNKRVDALYKTPAFREHLEFHFHSTKSVPAFLTTCVLPLSSLAPGSLALGIPSGTFSLEPPDSNLHVLESLSDLDLAMLICAARLDIVAHTDTVNFAMAYDEYTSQTGKLRVQSAASGMLALGGQARVWSRGVAAIAWERLIDLGMLIPAGVGAKGTVGQGGVDGKMWKVDVVLEEIPGAADLNSVLAKWCKEI